MHGTLRSEEREEAILGAEEAGEGDVTAKAIDDYSWWMKGFVSSSATTDDDDDDDDDFYYITFGANLL